MMRILKFGGSSLATADARRAARRLVERARREGPVAVVVSALGGVTDLLDGAVRAAALGRRTVLHRAIAELQERHEGVDPALLVELEHILFGLAALGEVTPRSRDLVLSFGERLSAPLFAAELGPEAVAFDGKEAGIVTDERFGEADPLREVTRFELGQRIGPVLTAGRVPVITGFVGATQHGAYTTLGRGGSDFTATLVGAALGAGEIWLCSDIAGLRATDPRIVPDAERLAHITFAEALEMVQFGAKGIHPRALEPAAEAGIPVHILDTTRPDDAGTVIVRRAPEESSERVARSVLLVSDIDLLTVAGAAMVGRPGTAARIFAAVAEAGANVLMISQSVSEAGISLALRSDQTEGVRAALEGALIRTGFVRALIHEPRMAIVAVLGEGMRGRRGVAAALFSAVAEAGVNVHAIAQGSSELSISFIVREEDGPAAVRAVYDRLIRPAAARGR